MVAVNPNWRIMLRLFCLSIFFAFSGAAWAQNPFAIEVPTNRELTNEDYLSIQQNLRKIDISDLLHQRYDHLGEGYTTYEDFYGRCMKGAHQVLIDQKKKLFPTRVFRKLGQGGDENCIVCAVPHSGKYPHYVRTLEKKLEQVGYNGYLLYYIGAWPNPTGEEIKYIGVPYSFKIFIMYEAYLLGCRNVLWVDSACYPLRNLTPLFKFIETKGALLNTHKMPSNQWRYILPATADELLELTGTDVYDPNVWFIITPVFGLRMDTVEAQELVKEYYRIVALGTPFLSCFPEEWVISAIMGRFDDHRIEEQRHNKLFRGTNKKNSFEIYEESRKLGFYFYHRKGR